VRLSRALPALFGLHIATYAYVLCELAGRPIERPLPVRQRTCCTASCVLQVKNQVRILFSSFRGARSSSLTSPPFCSSLPLTTADFVFVYDDFALGDRSSRPTPHHACGPLWCVGTPCASHPRKLCRGGDEGGIACDVARLCHA
jgi:tRNA threonylcarbamoyladenosine dehydratase